MNFLIATDFLDEVRYKIFRPSFINDINLALLNLINKDYFFAALRIWTEKLSIASIKVARILGLLTSSFMMHAPISMICYNFVLFFPYGHQTSG